MSNLYFSNEIPWFQASFLKKSSVDQGINSKAFDIFTQDVEHVSIRSVFPEPNVGFGCVNTSKTVQYFVKNPEDFLKAHGLLRPKPSILGLLSRH
jgi:hypothetical protein